MFVFNNDFEMEKEDRVLLKQDTPILSEKDQNWPALRALGIEL